MNDEDFAVLAAHLAAVSAARMAKPGNTELLLAALDALAERVTDIRLKLRHMESRKDDQA